MIYIRSSYIWISLLALLKTTHSDPISHPYKHSPNVPNARDSLTGIASIFSPRMDFEQWKPLTGRGDPLRNDPTYDYEPPMLDKVHYWADDTRTESQILPEKKSEVLVLGVSSRKPSVITRPAVPPKRHLGSIQSKYEDYSYKFNEHYPMTILVPPPPPPSGYKPLLFIHQENKAAQPTSPTHIVKPTLPQRFTASTPEIITSFALQEANLIYQATDNNQTWFVDFNKTQTLPANTVSSDYAGWGPTTPFREDQTLNYLHNLIPHKDHEGDSSNVFLDFSQSQSFQVPTTHKTLITPAFLPTSLPTIPSTTSNPPYTAPSEESTYETTTDEALIYEYTTTEIPTTTNYNKEEVFNSTIRPQVSVVDMLSSMVSMPLISDPERPEDHLYAHASENIQIFKDHTAEDVPNLEMMQTMQPPPLISNHARGTTPSLNKLYHLNSHIVNTHEKQPSHTHDPYLHMRFTTPLTPSSNSINISQDVKPTVDVTPMYLIIQGHSKVKTYGSKPKPINVISNNDAAKPYETNEVKHLHPIKDKYSKKNENKINRSSRSQNLTSLIDSGIGSIEIQEADIGIKYDVSDGSDVPVEVYRKGIVENAEENYSSSKKGHVKRDKRQIDLSDFIPFDEDTLEEYVYNYFETRKNDTGLTGIFAQAITSDAADSVIKDLEDEDRSYRKR